MVLNSTGSLIKGIVVSPFSDDPESINRVQVYLPSVHGKYDATKKHNGGNKTQYPWAQCAVQMGLNSVPKVDSKVWVMFETNNPQFPVVIGLISAGLEVTDSPGQGTGVGGESGSLAETVAKIIFGNEGRIHYCKLE